MKTFDKVMSHIEKPLSVIVFFVFLMMIVTMVMQVIARYIFKFGFAWSEELARYGLIWIVFFGAALIHVRGDKHMSMNAVEELLGSKSKQILTVVQEIIMLFFAGFIAYLGFKAMPTAALSLTPGLKIAKMYPYLAFPITGVIMIVASVNRIMHQIGKSNGKSGEESN